MPPKSFLPLHPTIIRRSKLNHSLQNVSHHKSLDPSMIDPEDEPIKSIIESQRKRVSELKEQIKEFREKNYVMEESLKFYNTEEKDQELTLKIEEAKAEQQEIINKIANCEKVEHSTTPEEYYLWQKKKKMDVYQNHLDELYTENQSERDSLFKICSELKSEIEREKEELARIVSEIEKIETEEVHFEESFEDEHIEEFFDVEAIHEEVEALNNSVKFLKENNEILATQLNSRIDIIAKGLHKSFESSKISLSRELKSIKRTFSLAPVSQPTQYEPQVSLEFEIENYHEKISEIESLLTEEEYQDAQSIITPFDWESFPWEECLESDEEDESNYKILFENMKKEVEETEKEISRGESKIREVSKENLDIQQRTMEIQSALNKLKKMMSN